MYCSPPVDTRFWPTVGNGHVAAVVYSDTVFMNGLYNGNGTESMRARIPAYTSVNIQSISQRQDSRMFTLDMKKGLKYSKTCLKRPHKKKTKNWFSRPIIA